MLRWRRFFGGLGIDNWILGLAGALTVVISLLDFTPFVNLTTDTILRIVLLSVGLLMAVAVVQARNRELEINQLREMLGAVEVQILDAKKSFPDHLVQSVLRADKFILDTNLSEDVPRLGGYQSQYRQILDEKLRKGQISFRKVEVIFTRERLERVLRLMLLHEGEDYFVRHYDPPPKVIPIMHIMSFDDERFYLGGFYPAGPSSEEKMIYIRHSEVAQFLREYWNVLWLRAEPLNEGKTIYWDKFKNISIRLNMSEDEFNNMVYKIRQEVLQQKPPATNKP